MHLVSNEKEISYLVVDKQKLRRFLNLIILLSEVMVILNQFRE